jgi:molecular chaperone GrpE
MIEPDGIEAEPSEQTQVAALESQLRRALADLDNLRKRLDREVARQRAAERADAAANWLPVVDNLERALEHAGADGDAVLDGVRAVRDEAIAVLARLGFPRYDDVGRPFDPARDEAVGAMPADAPPGTVVAIVRPGYGTAETVLRPAGVIVSKGTG